MGQGSIHARLMGLALAAALLAVAPGCESDPMKSRGEAFASDTEVRETTRLMDTQAAAGARVDATLYPAHFDGAALNSLGTAKLDRMLADDRAQSPIVIYMAIPEDPTADARRTTVANYLMDRGGLKGGQVRFESGPNPNVSTPAVSGLRNLAKTDSGAGVDPAGGSISGTSGLGK